MLILALLLGGPAAAKSGTYSNSTWGFTITYPSEFILITDPEALEQVASRGLDVALANHPESAALRKAAGNTAGAQFLMVYHPSQTGLPSNLSLVIEPVARKGVSNESYYRSAVAYLGRVNASLLGKPRKVIIRGREFYSQDYLLKRSDANLTNRFFMHYDPQRNTAYILTLSGVSRQKAKQVQALEKVVRSLSISSPERPARKPEGGF